VDKAENVEALHRSGVLMFRRILDFSGVRRISVLVSVNKNAGNGRQRQGASA
jgi:hypothetical protein